MPSALRAAPLNDAPATRTPLKQTKHRRTSAATEGDHPPCAALLLGQPQPWRHRNRPLRAGREWCDGRCGILFGALRSCVEVRCGPTYLITRREFLAIAQGWTHWELIPSLISIHQELMEMHQNRKARKSQRREGRRKSGFETSWLSATRPSGIPAAKPASVPCRTPASRYPSPTSLALAKAQSLPHAHCRSVCRWFCPALPRLPELHARHRRH